MKGTIDKDNLYFEDIVQGYVTGGAGTYDDGYIGTNYDLKEKFGIVVETPTEENAEKIKKNPTKKRKTGIVRGAEYYRKGGAEG